mmetsp:Transcript_10908/g.13783  ORF Transcript_10908/g.13783 Transcript_10908/m.13783 type:complete len:210 (-) Transcript_10908:399-1028(-)
MGFNKLAASIAPSVFPAPRTKCTSSTKRMILPFAALHSSRTAFRRSSNSPLYFAPATSAPISNVRNAIPFNVSGTSPSKMRRARPSTMAVLPTPGSPTRQGLFFVLLDNIWIVLLISSSRPITGSSFPSSAALIRSTPYLERASYDSSALVLVTFLPPLISSSAFMVSFFDSPAFTNSCLTSLSSYKLMKRWSNATRASPFALAALLDL